MYIIPHILLTYNYFGKIYTITAIHPTTQGYVGFLAGNLESRNVVIISEKEYNRLTQAIRASVYAKAFSSI